MAEPTSNPKPTPVADSPDSVPTVSPGTPTRPADGDTPRAEGKSFPELPGYEIEREVGRGGMGVVYRARQLSLNRVVAIKVIRDGALAGAEQLTRFRAEAEAVARLQHPNIVQIHDLDENKGQPFFAMEFMPGGSLAARLVHRPQPPREAAELVERLARAVHYAHQQGIVHRDLKPANVLLTAEGEPKVSDFGLVKRLDEASIATPSSGILGTPSYMAPEQASGQFKEIGPATDIHALGVILYETLTGRPPFEGETLAQTLDLVRFQEPAAPSRLSPDVPAELETICLRCLQKEPARRYASAAALAEDLQNFLEGKPPAAVGEPAHDSVHVPGYEVQDELARGGVWVVYRARDVRGKRLVALKRVRPGSPMTPEQLGRLRSTADEARKLRHPNIAELLDVGGRGARMHLALELVEGGSLARALTGQPWAAADAATFVATLAEAVQHAHEQGLIHCHLHPANVLLAPPSAPETPTPAKPCPGVPKLIGFEMARRRGELAEEDLDAIRPITPAMAPEQLFSKPEQVGPATDVYSLGVVLYELLTGRPPYQGTAMSDLLLKVGFEILQRPRHLNPAVPSQLDHVCLACLQKEPQERYASAAELAADLRRFLQGQRPTVVPPSWWERLRAWAGSRLGKRP